MRFFEVKITIYQAKRADEGNQLKNGKKVGRMNVHIDCCVTAAGLYNLGQRCGCRGRIGIGCTLIMIR